MVATAMVGLVDQRGWLLLQERDEHAPVDPDRWTLPGGAVEPGETTAEAARRELAEETGIAFDGLRHLGDHVLPCALHGADDVSLYAARVSFADADIECHEGRQIVFVDPARLEDLDLTDMTRAMYPLVLSSAAS